MILRIDGREYVFGSSDVPGQYGSFWEADYDDWRPGRGWTVISEYLPDGLRGMEEEIKAVLDENVEQSCCGGCV